MNLQNISKENFLNTFYKAFPNRQVLWSYTSCPDEVINNLNSFTIEEFENFRTFLLIELFNFKSKNEILEFYGQYSSNLFRELKNEDIKIYFDLVLDYVFKKTFEILSDKYLDKNTLQNYYKIPNEIKKLEKANIKLMNKITSPRTREIDRNILTKLIQIQNDEIVRLQNEDYLLSNIKTNGAQTISILNKPSQGRKTCEFLNELIFRLRINSKDKYPTYYKKHIILPTLNFISVLFPEFISKEEMYYLQNIENLDARIKYILANISDKDLSMGEN